MDYLLWCDIETTGLDTEYDFPLEIALFLTDMDLKFVGDHPFTRCIKWDALPQPKEFVQQMHTTNGLWEDIERRGERIHMVEAAAQDWLHNQPVMDLNTVYLAGGSIHFDRSFVRRFFPILHEFVHYRMLDVSAFKLMMKHWSTYAGFHEEPTAKPHRALADARDSLELMRAYRDWINPEIMRLAYHEHKPFPTETPVVRRYVDLDRGGHEG